jgi:hypothetical protein
LLGDECFGIAYLENRIVVKSKERGIIAINLNGTWEKEHPKVTGELPLCAGLRWLYIHDKARRRQRCSIQH